MSPPKIAIGALGGTLSMQSRRPGEGITPSLGGQALLASVAELADLAQIHVETLSLVPSASLTFDFLLDVLSWADSQIEKGARGVVITQGTDTLEETATFFEYLWDHDEPMVLTGAMRSAGQVGADGPANLLDACKVALVESSRKRGVMIVMNGEIHEALNVRKTNTMSLQAFSSPIVGPTGMMIENNIRYLGPPAHRRILPWPVRTTQKVILLEATLGADTLILERLLELSYEGLVIAGFGAGHVSDAWANALEPIAAKIPAILSTRAGAGTTACNTYGFAGSEMDMARKGLHLSGFLCPRKARILLWLLIGSGRQQDLPTYLSQ